MNIPDLPYLEFTNKEYQLEFSLVEEVFNITLRRNSVWLYIVDNDSKLENDCDRSIHLNKP